MTEDLTVWLAEQVAGDERVARLASRGPWSVNDRTFPESIHDADGDNVISGGEARIFDAFHMEAWNPARVLAECDAKRRIIARHAPRIAREGPNQGELICGCSDGTDEFLSTTWPCADVRDIASVFADRPGYRQEWTP